MEYITSRQNPLAARIRKLNSSRAARREAGLFVGEGPKLLEEAVKAGVRIDTLVTAQGTRISGPEGTRRVEVPPGLLKSLCDTQTPQGVLFLAHRRRPWGGRPAAGEPLCRPLFPQDGALHHGGLLPPAPL